MPATANLLTATGRMAVLDAAEAVLRIAVRNIFACVAKKMCRKKKSKEEEKVAKGPIDAALRCGDVAIDVREDDGRGGGEVWLRWKLC